MENHTTITVQNKTWQKLQENRAKGQSLDGYIQELLEQEA